MAPFPQQYLISFVHCFWLAAQLKITALLGLNVLGLVAIIRNAGASLCWKQRACQPWVMGG
jgi:hypothetical protein